MAAETGFMIDGTLYEVPDMGTFTMDELQVLYDYSGLTLEDFVEPENETEEDAKERARNLRHPGFMRALMHIAYQRGNPKLQAGRVKALVGSANVMTALENLTADEDEEAEESPGADERASRIIADKLARERQLAGADERAFWDEFNERFGRTGRDPRRYYTWEVGAVLSLAPGQFGDLKPVDLLGAARHFDALYRSQD